MAALTVEEARIRVALANPNMSSADVRREAERVIGTLDSIEAEDALRTALNAQAADAEAQQAIEAQRRSEALSVAQSVVRQSHPGWDNASVDMEARRLDAENDAAIASMNLRDSLAGGYDKG